MRKQDDMFRSPFFRVLSVSILIVFLFLSCEKEQVSSVSRECDSVNNVFYSTQGVDSLIRLQRQKEQEGDLLGSILTLKKIGSQLYKEYRFEETLNVYFKELLQAGNIGDTLEYVQTLNDIGLIYRQMGMLDMGCEYYYRANKMSGEYADTSSVMLKNRAVSLNGLGKISIIMGDYFHADSTLRLALSIEQKLYNKKGQAVNYADIGFNYESQGKIDSAYIYYSRSMELYQEIGDILGLSQCSALFGSLYTKQLQYDKAIKEYDTAYKLMKSGRDEWHALNVLIALAKIYIDLGDNTLTLEYLGNALKASELLNSKMHLSEIYTLYFQYYKQQKNYRDALRYSEYANAILDSIKDIEMAYRVKKTGLNIERSRQIKKMSEVRTQLEQERIYRYRSYIFFTLIFVLMSGIIVTLFYIHRLRRRNHNTLKQISIMRERFFTNISHEFRMPLTVILGLSQDLQNTTFGDVKEKIQAIERQGKGLLELLNQLLDISKIKSSVGNAEWFNGNIVAHVSMIVETYRSYARHRNIDFSFIAKEEVVLMNFVPDYVSKVMNNLIFNAFKFTPDYGKINIIMWRVRQNLFVDIQDTGKGIDEKSITYIFDPFYQGENAYSDIGTGLGLTLVKQIVNAVNGKITVDSVLHKGTTFHICVPIRNNCKHNIAETSQINVPIVPAEKKEPPIVSDSNQCRILIVENNRDIAVYMGSIFSNHYAIEYAFNGTEGLEKAIDVVPDLIITDLLMPGIDGLELCRQVRKNEIVSHIPIIMVTARVTEEERIMGIKAGADAYLPKPFNSDELRTLAQNLLNRRISLQKKFSKQIFDRKEEKEIKPVQTARDKADQKFLAKVVEAVYSQIDKQEDIDVSLVASSVCMSYSQFYRKINALTGYTPVSYIQHIKIKRARALIEQDAQISCYEVAEKSGFKDYSNFVRAFKKLCGITPAEYKKSMNMDVNEEWQ